MEKKYKATYVLFGLILMVGLTMATTTISSTGVDYDGSSTYKSTSIIDFYPRDQTSQAIRFDIVDGLATIYTAGADNITFMDDINLKTADQVIKSGGSQIDMFPAGQTAVGLRIALSGGDTILSSYGSSNIKFDDSIYLSAFDKKIKSASSIELYPRDQTTLGFRFETNSGTPTLSTLGSTALHIDEEVKLLGVASDGTGKALCILASGNIGTCTDAVGATGTCTCA